MSAQHPSMDFDTALSNIMMSENRKSCAQCQPLCNNCLNKYQPETYVDLRPYNYVEDKSRIALDFLPGTLTRNEGVSTISQTCHTPPRTAHPTRAAYHDWRARSKNRGESANPLALRCCPATRPALDRQSLETAQLTDLFASASLETEPPA